MSVHMRPHYFRADFVAVIGTTLILRAYHDNVSNEGHITQHSIPVEWVVRACSLVDILGKYVCLPPEILDIVDNYV